MFLSANNFFWKVDKQAPGPAQDRRSGAQVGRPEAALIGVQYRANDDGQQQGLYTVQAAAARAVAVGRAPASSTARRSASSSAATGSRSTRRRRDSPPGTTVVAQIPDLFGPGHLRRR